MYQYTIHVPLFDDLNDRRTIHIHLAPDPSLIQKPLRHWAQIILPLDQIDQNTLTEQQRQDGYNAGLLYWCLIQEAGLHARLCAAAHVGDLLPLDRINTDALVALQDEIHSVHVLLDDRDFEEYPASRIEERTATFPEFYNCIDKAREWDERISKLIARRQPCMAPVRNGRPGFVYLLRSVSGYWKIGRTVSPQNRLKTFGIQLPFEVEFEHLIPTDNMTDSELALHARFASKRVKGEWFALSDEDVAYIKTIERM